MVGAGRACLCPFHARVSGETDWGSISSPVRGESLSQEGSDIVNPVILSTAFSPSFPSSLLSEPTFPRQTEVIILSRLEDSYLHLRLDFASSQPLSHTQPPVLYERVSRHPTVQL